MKNKSHEQRFSYINQSRIFHPYVSGQLQLTLRKLSVLFALCTILIGSIVLLGWQLDIPLLRSIFPALPEMKTNSAIAVVLAGLGILLSYASLKNRLVWLMRYAVSMSIVLIGLLTLIQYIYGINLGIDELIYKEAPGSIGTVFPNRMAPNSAAIFVLIGLSILFLDQQVFKKWIYQWFVLLGVLLLLPTVIGYVYDVEFIYGIVTGTQIAVPTAVSFVLLFSAILFLRPRRGVMQLGTSDTAGGFLVRRLTILTVVIPLLLGWLMLVGNRLGWYDAEFRHLLHVSTSIVVFTYFVWRNARSLHLIDDNRREIEQNILFLAQISKVLSTSLDYRTTLNSVAQLTVPTFADWCSIDVLDQNGRLKQVVLYHRDPKKLRLLKQLRSSYPTDMHANAGREQVAMTGKPEFTPIVTKEILKGLARNAKHYSLLQKLRISSRIIVPILSHKKPIGTISLILSDPARSFIESDLFIAEEIASRTSLAIENARLYHDAQNAIKLRDEFISIASHELKTPLTSLKVYAQIIQRQFRKTGDEKILTYVNRLDKQIDNLAELVRDLLDISRMQVGKLDFHFDYFNLGDLVIEIVQSLQTTTEHKLHVKNEIKELVYGDRERIGQIIVNFITNAIKYSPDANRVDIILSQTETDDTLAVRDYGIGIDKKYIRQIFEKFFQVKDTRKRHSSGLGIGLFISNAIAERHNGKITVESEKGKGSTFSFILPRKRRSPKIQS